MAMTPAERKRNQRAKAKLMDVKDFRMDLTGTERWSIQKAAARQGYEDQTEYLLDLVYADLQKPASRACNYPDCTCPFDKPEGGTCYQGFEEPPAPSLHEQIREAFAADQAAEYQTKPAAYPYELVGGELRRREQ